MKTTPGKINAKVMLKLYHQGLPDTVIALQLGVTPGAVCHRRRKMGLPAVGMTEAARRLGRAVLERRRKVWNQQVRARKRPLPSHLKELKTPSWKFGSRRPYEDEERCFLQAILEWRGRNGRAPSLVEGFRIARELGYTKEATWAP